MRVKSASFEANSLLQSSVKFENEWSSISTPKHAFTGHCFQLGTDAKIPFLDFRDFLKIRKSTIIFAISVHPYKTSLVPKNIFS
jgi:hypothetical protein